MLVGVYHAHCNGRGSRSVAEDEGASRGFTLFPSGAALEIVAAL